MPAIDIGDPLPGLNVTFTSDGTSTGTPVDPSGGVALTITLPDGVSTVSPAVTHGGTGQWSADYVPTTGGLFRAVWTGSGTGGQVITQTFSVGDPVGIDDLRKALKTTAATDELLYEWVAAATDWAQDRSGRALRAGTLTERKMGGKYAVALSTTPVKAIVSVSVNGTLAAATDYELDPGTGLLYRGTMRSGLAWSPGWVEVTYTTDVDLVPARFRQGITEYVRWLAANYRGSSGQPQAGATPDDALRAAEKLVPSGGGIG